MKANTLTLTKTIDLLRTNKLSHKELYDDVFNVIKKKNPLLNVYLALDGKALEKAEKLKHLPLAGVPVAVKDNFLTVGLETTASAKLLSGFMPPYESTVTTRLKKSGGVVVGKTNMDAWAHGSSTETSDFGPAKNPHNTAHVPGGSSGGSAAAVAGDMCIAAIGSIRVPAAWCGIVGLKPTYGRVPRTGVVAMGSSLDSPGPMTKTVEDAALLLTIIAGKDPYDATSGNAVVHDYTKSLTKGIKGLRVGICYTDYPALHGTQVVQSIKEAGKLFESLGAHVDLVPLSNQLKPDAILTPDYAIGVYTVIQRSEVSSNLARYDGIRYGHDRSFFGAEAKKRIMLGTFTLSKGYADKYYVRAQQVRNMYIKNFHELFSKYDILISSPTPGYALKFGEDTSPLFGELMDVLNEPSAMAGLTAMSVPCYWNKETKLPLGLSIMADHWQEEKVLRAAFAYESHTSWNPWVQQ
jgi:aspartyl-tRNA(Asn)/glutamyl-tRNA(Gln) amidotransferase subunit A